MDEWMIELLGIIIGQVLGILLWAAILNAPILQWRARKLKHWNIRYKDAYLVSIKAGFIAAVLSLAVTLGIVLLVPLDADAVDVLSRLVGVVVALLSWWLAHSNALLKLSGPHGLLSVNEARSISGSVLGFMFIVVFGAVLGVVLLFALWSLVT